MNNAVMVSLCMPTNGVVEWVFPVLDSIYSQGVDEELFEVVITDNGDNDVFKKRIAEYILGHSNIVYAETKALPFLNEIEAYKRAKGQLIKFVNHRTLLLEGALQRLIDFTHKNLNEKPIVYFTNGVLNIPKKEYFFETFDQFVRKLSYWSSWSTGMAIWKSDLDKLEIDESEYNELFPHTNILFGERKRGKYVIDNSIIFNELPQGKTAKGNYDLFSAFGIEYPWIICTLLRDKSIKNSTFRYVIDKNLWFIAKSYCEYFILKRYCSYDLSGLSNMYGVFYTRTQLAIKVVAICLRKLGKKVLGR